MPDPKDIRFDQANYRQRAGKRESQSRVHQLQVARQAAVKAEALTGHVHWDHYLSLLQHAVEQARATADELRRKLEHPANNSHEGMLDAKAGLRECEAHIVAWEWAMSLPKVLIESGGKADEMLKDFDARAEDSPAS